MQEEKEKQILNLNELGPNLLDILPLDYFISNQELPHIDEVKNLKLSYRDEVRNQELPHIDEVGDHESPLIDEIRNQELPRDESSVDSTTLSNQEQQSKQLKRKRKRPPKTGEKVHTKDASDNILRKIQVHYLSFVVYFMNALLKKSEYSYKFIGIDYNIKKVISKKNFLLFKKKNIGEILCHKASPKFRTKNEENNFIIYEKVKENKDVNYFLSQNFMKLFKDVYLKFKNKRSINENGKRTINENGIVFDLPEKVETFDDFLNKQKRKYDDIKEYEQKINDVIKKSYLDFFIVKNNKLY